MHCAISSRQTGSAVGSMAMCVALLIASEFMPASLLRPIAADWALAPIVLASLLWQWISLPSMPPHAVNAVGKVFRLLRRRNVAFAMDRKLAARN
jgi:predicted MFS family arabinose efflux permease